MRLIRPNTNRTRCPNCGGHLASIDHGLRECEQCGRKQKETTP